MSIGIIINRLKHIFNSTFKKNIMMVAGGTAFAQILNALLSPVVTRIYSPQEYGILTVYIAILGLIAVIGSLSYEYSIPIADDDHKAINSVFLSIIILLLLTLCISFVLFFFGNKALGLWGGKSLLKYRYFISFGFLFSGFYQIFMKWAYRKRDYKGITKTKFSQSISQNTVIIGLGALGFGPIGLILGRILGESAGVTTLASTIFKKESYLLKYINKESILWNLKRYKRFPFYFTPNQFMIIAAIQLPVLFITQLYGSQIIGFYGLANGIVNLPMTLIGNAVRDVFFAEAANIGRSEPERIKELSNKLLKKLIIIAIIPTIVLLLFGPILFSFVFGDVWHEAGIYGSILSFMIFTKFIFTPISGIYTIFEKLKESFFISLLRIVLVLGAFSIAKAINLNPYYAVGLYSLVISILYLIYYLVAQKIISVEIQRKKSII